jgi:glycosyltransferase involved in cell wall biosynthesis
MAVLPLDHGAAQRICSLACHLARRGHEVTIVSILFTYRHSFQDVRSSNLRIMHIPITKIHRLPLDCITNAHILQFEFPYQPFLMTLVKGLGKPIILDEHGVEIHFMKEARHASGQKFQKRMLLNTSLSEWMALRLSSVVFACSNIDAGKIEMIYKIPRERIVVIPNGVDETFFKYANAVHYEKPTVIFMGSFDHRPNVHATIVLLSDIVPKVLEKVPDALFVFIGRNPPLWLMKRNKHNALILGMVKDPRPYIAGADVAIAPIYYGSGTRLKILEYLALGKAVVSTSKGIEGLDLKNGEHLLIKDKPAEFAEGICQLLINKELASKLGESGRRLISEKYLWKNIVRKVEQTYYKLLD